MGAFFGNIQVQANTPEIQDRIIALLKAYNLANGYIITNDSNTADKSIIVYHNENSGFIAVYDEELEEMQATPVNALSAFLSKQLGTACLGTLVADSDYLYAALFVNGIKKDNITNKGFAKSNAQAWQSILANGHTFKDIEKAWSNSRIFTEEFLVVLAGLTGIAPATITTGYNYFANSGLAGGTRINFTLKDRGSLTPTLPVKFQLVYGAGSLQLTTGAETEASWLYENLGKASTGIEISISGNAVDTGLFKPLKAFFEHESYRQDGTFTALFHEQQTTDGKTAFFAAQPDIDIPQGCPLPADHRDYKRHNKQRQKSAIKITVTFKGIQHGSGTAHIFFSPMHNPDNGHDQTPITIAVL